MNWFPEKIHDFSPTDPPHGMRTYDFGSLSKHQKQLLNRVKMKQRKENEIYLRLHPEIKGLISIVLRHVLEVKPLAKVHEFFGDFFNRPHWQVARDLFSYMKEQGYSEKVLRDLEVIVGWKMCDLSDPSTESSLSLT